MKLLACVQISITVPLLVLAGCSKSPTAPVSASELAPLDTARITAIEIMPETGRLRIGQTESFSVLVVLDPGIPPSGPLPVWSSTNPAVATIDGSGLLKAEAAGTTVIGVKFKGTSATRQISVIP
jgi:hypothetical protein